MGNHRISFQGYLMIYSAKVKLRAARTVDLDSLLAAKFFYDYTGSS